MQYVSSRGGAPALDFEGALLAGLAGDGGLYLPAAWPQVLTPERLDTLAGRPYAEVAAAVLRPFVGEAIAAERLDRLVQDSYAGFGHRTVAPLRQLGADDWLLELFHGPTLAFKDIALQLLGRLFDEVLTRRRRRVTIIGATSGDTGSAAIEACRGRPSLDIFILFPHGRVSEVQRRQMTTVADGNVHCLALEGTFDDCQAMVKALFADVPLRQRFAFSAVNSINWARVAAQIVYYATAALALGAPRRQVAFSVPTGNFGDVFAGYAAARMGLPVERLIVATNRNDILARFFAGGAYRTGAVSATISPSMDIQVASNFERLLFELYGRDGAAVSRLMADLAARGGFQVPAERLSGAALFRAARVDEAETLAEMGWTWRETGLLVDPHTAVALAAGRACRPGREVPLVTLATAHPAKFPDAVERATGQRPALPERLAGLLARPEKQAILPNEIGAVRAYIEAHARPVSA